MSTIGSLGGLNLFQTTPPPDSSGNTDDGTNTVEPTEETSQGGTTGSSSNPTPDNGGSGSSGGGSSSSGSSSGASSGGNSDVSADSALAGNTSAGASLSASAAPQGASALSADAIRLRAENPGGGFERTLSSTESLFGIDSRLGLTELFTPTATETTDTEKRALFLDKLEETRSFGSELVVPDQRAVFVDDGQDQRLDETA